MQKVIVIVGQTAVGKTNLSEKLALLINGEIINGDAMQVYKQLNIVTAKIAKEDMVNVPHHLFDIKNIDENYSVEQYQENIRNVINDVLKRGKTPIIVGGTGLYIKAALYDYNFDKVEISNADIEKKYQDFDNEQLYKYLQTIDKESSLTIHPNNRRRVLRAIAIYETTGKSKSDTIKSQEHKMLYDALIFGLYLPKEKLIENINIRVDQMIKDGLIEEIKNNPTTSTASKAIGFKEINNYLQGQTSLQEAIELIKIHTRQYAKRQMTWFKNQFNVNWILNDDKAIENIQTIIENTK